MKRILASALLSTACLAGCGASVKFVATQPPPHPMTAKPVESVTIYQSPPTDRKYVEVGRIEVSWGMANTDGFDATRAKVRAEAAKRGCDGIIELGLNQSMSATCIAFTESTSQPSRPTIGQ